MEFTGKLTGITSDWGTGGYKVTFSVNERESIPDIEKLGSYEKLRINAKKFFKKRSKDANALLWACLGEIAVALSTDKWSVYLRMLRRYGKYTYICVKPHVVEPMKLQWRESEVIGEVDINGQKAVQMLCYFGSSTYDAKEFSVLLDGVISEMEEMGLTPPPTGEMRRSLELWQEKSHP